MRGCSPDGAHAAELPAAGSSAARAPLRAAGWRNADGKAPAWGELAYLTVVTRTLTGISGLNIAGLDVDRLHWYVMIACADDWSLTLPGNDGKSQFYLRNVSTIESINCAFLIIETASSIMRHVPPDIKSTPAFCCCMALFRTDISRHLRRVMFCCWRGWYRCREIATVCHHVILSSSMNAARLQRYRMACSPRHPGAPSSSRILRGFDYSSDFAANSQDHQGEAL